MVLKNLWPTEVFLEEGRYNNVGMRLHGERTEELVA